MKNKTIKIFVNKSDEGKRLDVILSKKIDDYTRSHIKNLIKLKKVKINNKLTLSQSKIVKDKDCVDLIIEENKNDKIIPSKKKLHIVFEDEDLIIINKPQGMVVHPGAGNIRNTMVNALMGIYKNNLSNLSGSQRPGIVHRIDKETSGLLVVAKNNYTHSRLGKQFSSHTILRKYCALIWGTLRPMNGKIETNITRNKKNRKLMTVDEFKGKRAITYYKTLKTFEAKDIPKISLVEFRLLTGRTHQIRVHMQHKGTSILGDLKYKKRNVKYKKISKTFSKFLGNLNGQILHAGFLGFSHPRTGKNIEFEIKIPKNFEKLVKFLEKQKN